MNSNSRMLTWFCVAFITLWLPSIVFAKEDNSLQSQLPKVQKKEGQLSVIEWLDENSKKPSLIQKFDVAGNLIFESEHRPNSKQPVKITRISLKKQESRIEHFDSKTGHLEKIEIRTVRGEKRIVEVRIPSQKKGLPDKVTISEMPAWEFAKNGLRCRPSAESMASLHQIGDLKDFLGKITVTGKTGKYLTTSMGVLIDPACMSLHGEDFPAVVQSALSEGLACTKELEGFGSRGNVRKITSLLGNNKNPIKIECSETSYSRWKVADARATLPGMSEYPKVSINPTSKRPRNGLKNTLFHEMFHLIGYGHHLDMEYAYACSTCCFDKKSGYKFPRQAKVIEASCEICKGDFENKDDPEYLRALIAFAEYPGKDFAASSIFEKIIENEEVSDENMKLMAQYLASDPFFFPLYSEFHALKSAKLSLPQGTSGPSNSALRQTSTFVAVAINSADAGKYAEALTALENGLKYLPRYDDNDTSTSGFQVQRTYRFYETFIQQLKVSGGAQEKLRAGALMTLLDQKKLKISK